MVVVNANIKDVIIFLSVMIPRLKYLSTTEPLEASVHNVIKG